MEAILKLVAAVVAVGCCEVAALEAINLGREERSFWTALDAGEGKNW